MNRSALRDAGGARFARGLHGLASATLASLLLLPALPSLAAAPSTSTASGASGASAVQRGEYLATIGGCAACHTVKGGAPFAGGLLLETPFGPLSTPNITPDRDTGIGRWTDDQFYKAMHDGIGKNGEYLYPAMPFPWYTQVSRDDVLAIKAYLFAQPPVREARVDSHLTFPFNVREALLAWRALFFKAASPQATVAAAGAVSPIERGAYLVNGLGHCGECHNGRWLGGASKFGKPLNGGAIDDWYAPNISSDVRDGIGGWSDAQLMQFLKTGTAEGKSLAVGPMSEAMHSLGKITDDDLRAMVAYLKSTPAVPNGDVSDGGSNASRAAGAQTYLSRCASCHGVEGKGQAGVVPPLAGNGAVTAQGPQNVIQVVLGGLEARQEYAPMLAIGAGMGDGEVADVANYVRTAWGNRGGANASPGMVGELRATIDTPMTAGRLQGCPAIAPAALARAVADPKRGIASRIGATTEDDMASQVAAIVSRVKAAAPALGKADVVNGLTAAYCNAVRNDQALDWNAKALRLGHFSTLVYMQLNSNAPIAKRR